MANKESAAVGYIDHHMNVVLLSYDTCTWHDQTNDSADYTVLCPINAVACYSTQSKLVCVLHCLARNVCHVGIWLVVIIDIQCRAMIQIDVTIAFVIYK